MNLLDFMREQAMQHLRYEDRDPNELKQEPKPVKVTLVYGWGVEQQETMAAINARKQRKTIK
jgi:hypothetical protein